MTLQSLDDMMRAREMRNHRAKTDAQRPENVSPLPSSAINGQQKLKSIQDFTSPATPLNIDYGSKSVEALELDEVDVSMRPEAKKVSAPSEEEGFMMLWKAILKQRTERCLNSMTREVISRRLASSPPTEFNKGSVTIYVTSHKEVVDRNAQ